MLAIGPDMVDADVPTITSEPSTEDSALVEASLSLVGSPFAEAGGVALVVLTLAEAIESDVTVHLAFSGTAALNTDYTATGTSISILAGTTTGSVLLTAVQDALHEGDESLIIDVESVVNALLTGPQQLTATITDDDPPPQVALSLAGSPLLEAGGSATLTATLSEASALDVTVVLAFSGTAAIDQDYTASATSLVIRAGETTASITLAALDDLLVEGPETIVVEIQSAANATAAEAQLEVDLVDDDPQVSLALSETSLVEGAGSVVVTATLSALSDQDVTIVLSLAGTAQQGVDYEVSETSIVVPAGEMAGGVTITVVDDLLNEADETIVVSIQSVANGTAGSPQEATATIDDDDLPPHVTLSMSDDFLSESGGLATVTATLSAASGQEVTVLFAFSGSATLDADYTAATTLVIPAGETTGSITLTMLSDLVYEADETIVIAIDSAANAEVGFPSQLQAMIVDDDMPPEVTLSLSGSPFAENGGRATVTATLSAVSGRDATVTLVFSGTATLGVDYHVFATSIVIPAGETSASLTLTGIADTLDEEDETIVVEVANLMHATQAAPQQVSALILNAAPPRRTVILGGDAGSTVRVVDVLSGETLVNVVVYGPEFTGGVRVAAADLNFDGVPDIIAAPGPGRAPTIRVFDGQTGELFSGRFSGFLAYAEAFTGGVYVAAGDLNGDGVPDIVTGAGYDGGPHLRVFSGEDGSLLADFFAYHFSFTGGVRVAVGDIDADGALDIITSPGLDGGPHVRVFRASGINLPGLPGNFWGVDPQYTGGISVAAAELTGDAHGDIVVGRDSGSAVVALFDGSTGLQLTEFAAFGVEHTGGVRVAAGDFVEGAQAEIVVFSANSPLVRVFDAQSLMEVASIVAFDGVLASGVHVATQVAVAAPLRAAPGTLPAETPPPLTEQELDAIRAAVLLRWHESGIDQAALARLAATPLYIADLADDLLGLSTGGAILIDRDAAGRGWFVDPTPLEDEEFNWLADLHYGMAHSDAARSGIDLATVLAHEYGHLLDWAHEQHALEPWDLMHATLAPGERKSL